MGRRGSSIGYNAGPAGLSHERALFLAKNGERFYNNIILLTNHSFTSHPFLRKIGMARWLQTRVVERAVDRFVGSGSARERGGQNIVSHTATESRGEVLCWRWPESRGEVQCWRRQQQRW
mmetsp:Transcript_18669/g.32100  ORF Transcript_18669/g.32100 Transcript_18669/m.32100 type:complete len:120 (+) Transcript_18669:88-447(+)